MPATLSYPGVYIEEIPSGVHTIIGVATSITAFVGRALRGTVDADDKSPVRIFSFAEYERLFGVLSADSTMSFAVFQYFLNGGSDALIIRVHNGAKTAKTSDGNFEAANPGAWGGRVRLRVDHDLDPEIENANPSGTIFNLKVKDLGTGVTETFLNVSITKGHPRFVSDVLLQSSSLLRCVGTFTRRPPPTATPSPPVPDPFDDTTATKLEVDPATADGSDVEAAQIGDPGLRSTKQGLYALEKADLFNLLCIPPFAPDKDVDS